MKSQFDVKVWKEKRGPYKATGVVVVHGLDLANGLEDHADMEYIGLDIELVLPVLLLLHALSLAGPALNR